MPGDKRYDPLAKRLADRDRDLAGEALREIEEEIAEQQSELSMASALQRLIERRGVETGNPDAVTAAAEYLRPYIERLQIAERGLPPFPENSNINWSLVEFEVLDVEANQSMASIAKRFGITTDQIYGMSRKRRWKARRSILEELQARFSAARILAKQSAVIQGEARPQPSEEDIQEVFYEILRTNVQVYREMLNEGKIKISGPKDLDTLARLAAFLEGRAERITEERHRISPDILEAMLLRVGEKLNLSAEDIGLVSAEYEVVEFDPGRDQPEADVPLLESLPDDGGESPSGEA